MTPRAMPESIIPAVASSLPEETTVIIPAIVKWLWWAFGVVALTTWGCFSRALYWLFKKQKESRDEIDKDIDNLKDDISALSQRHDQDMRMFLTHCSECRDKDFEKWKEELSDAKEDIKGEMNNGFNGVKELIASQNKLIEVSIRK